MSIVNYDHAPTIAIVCIQDPPASSMDKYLFLWFFFFSYFTTCIIIKYAILNFRSGYSPRIDTIAHGPGTNTYSRNTIEKICKIGFRRTKKTPEIKTFGRQRSD